uniref:Uncharacterized protein n=1 Tax=Anguilla anguilla TaxID=7936 RepID=A0A0E9QJF2_ANGAN
MSYILHFIFRKMYFLKRCSYALKCSLIFSHIAI